MKNLIRKVARRWLKKAAPIEIPPKMLEKTENFMIPAYAGHVLAKTRRKIRSIQEKQLESLEQRKERFLDLLENVFDNASRHEEFQTRLPLALEGNYLLVKLEYGDFKNTFSYKWERDQGRSTRTFEIDQWEMREKAIELRQKELKKFNKRLREIRRLELRDSKIVDLILLEKEAEKLAQKPKAIKTATRKTLDIDLSGWSYLKDNNPIEKKVQKEQRLIDRLEDMEQKVKNDQKKAMEWLESDPSVGDHLKIITGIDYDKSSGDMSNVVTKSYDLLVRGEPGNKKVSIEQDDLTGDLGSTFIEEAVEGRFKSGLRRIDTQTMIARESLNQAKKYLNDMEGFLEAMGWSQIKVMLFFEKHKRRGGVWKAFDRELQVDVGMTNPSKKSTFLEEVESIRDTIRHELRHFAQDILKKAKGLSEDAGLPSPSMRSEGINPSGVPYGSHKRTQPHALRDVEFQTRLGDEIRRFIRAVKNKVQPDDYRDFFRVWTAQEQNPGSEMNRKYRVHSRRFFESLKKNQPEKWREAVKELFKETAKAGIDFGGDSFSRPSD